MKTEINFELTGITPLRTHNGQMADPMDPYTRELKPLVKKRTKTEADDERIAFLQARGAMYVEDGKIVIPDRNIHAMFRDAASVKRLKAKCIRFLRVFDVELTFDGPQDPDERAKDPNLRDRRLVNGNPASSRASKVIRNRPIFNEWSITGRLVFPTGEFNVQDLKDIMELCGVSGCCERFDGFGQFDLTKWEVKQ